MRRFPLLAALAAVIIVLVAVALTSFTSSQTAADLVITPAEYTTQYVTNAAAHVLLDVRTPEEFASGSIPGALNISVQELSARLSEVPRDVPVIVYCRSGNRSAQALALLTEAGYTQVYDLGGISEWQAAGLPLE
jgi:rhodanese-related sulfurtransferase